MSKILISTYPFGKCGTRPIDLLKELGHEITYPPHKRRLKATEVKELISGVDAVIAGTEPYTEETLSSGNRLKVISRVGIGLDNVDLAYCMKRGIRVSYTPDAPSDGVAELTVANILNLLRHIHKSDRSVRERAWNRFMGKLVHEVTIGILGVGRIGSRVIKLLQPFKPKILAVDIDDSVRSTVPENVEWCSLEELLIHSDIITIHIPLNSKTNGLIGREKISKMKTGAMLINTARGSIVDEQALYDALIQQHLSGAALDVFKIEPYEGPFSNLENVILTAHIAASANETRYLMELGAVEDCLRILNGEEPKHDAIKESLI
jgi:D-3-phosphoglycerate dehydrogenase